MVSSEDLQALVGGGCRLGQTIVQVVGDSATLLILGHQQLPHEVVQAVFALEEFLVEPGVVYGVRRLAAQVPEDIRRIVLSQGSRTVHLKDADEAVPDPEWQAKPDQARSPWFSRGQFEQPLILVL
jgi:hypothetical protein